MPRVVNRVREDGTKMGPRGRLLVVMISNVVAAPFAMAALLVEDSVPWGFIPLIFSNRTCCDGDGHAVLLRLDAFTPCMLPLWGVPGRSVW